ncbi:hypothetical protein LTR42_007008 [Elasticomyces elasticus]|nr:hypothetical protein LTR42_007008 [Elasticomyces elasticus]
MPALFQAMLTALLATAANAAATCPTCPKASMFPTAEVSLYAVPACPDTGAVNAPRVRTLTSGSCFDNGQIAILSFKNKLNGLVPPGYFCKVAIYTGADCSGAGTTTSNLGESGVQGQCYDKLINGQLALGGGGLGGRSIGFYCYQVSTPNGVSV